MHVFPVMLHLASQIDVAFLHIDVVVATSTHSSCFAVTGQRFKVLDVTPIEILGQISLEDLSEVGESVVRQRCSQPLEIELVFCAFCCFVDALCCTTKSLLAKDDFFA